MQISVVICTYRRSDVLPAAIESLLSQSLPNDSYEILVIDNNSQDETAEIVQRYTQGDLPKVRYILETRQGLSYARNKGVELAVSDIVAFIDDDAVADSDWLLSLIDAYDSSPNTWAVGGEVRPIWGGKRPEWLKDTMLRGLSIVEWGNEKRPLKWPERIIGTNYSLRKQVFSAVGLFATNLGRRGTLLLGNEDTEIQERIHELGKLVIYTPHAVVHHHVPQERMTKKYFYRRSYGTGRSQAILASQKDGYSEVLKQILRIGYAIPRQTLNILRCIRKEEIQFQQLQEQAYQIGYLYQAIGMFLFWKRELSG